LNNFKFEKAVTQREPQKTEKTCIGKSGKTEKQNQKICKLENISYKITGRAGMDRDPYPSPMGGAC
jgi:hypothetical protein